MSDNNDARQWLEDIESSSTAVNGVRLTEWEENFCQSIRDQLDDGRRLSEKQLEKLRDIWDRV